MSRYIDLDQVEFLKTDGNKEFNHGVDCCINRLLKADTIKAIPLDKIKQAREEIKNIAWKTYKSKIVDVNRAETELIDREDVLAILDKLIESEG